MTLPAGLTTRRWSRRVGRACRDAGSIPAPMRTRNAFFYVECAHRLPWQSSIFA